LLPQLALPPALLGCLFHVCLYLLVQLLLMVSPLHKLLVLHLRLLEVQAPPDQIYLQELPHHPAFIFCIVDLLLPPVGHLLLRPRTPGLTKELVLMIAEVVPIVGGWRRAVTWRCCDLALLPA
jgi:hypothetical protein